MVMQRRQALAHLSMLAAGASSAFVGFKETGTHAASVSVPADAEVATGPGASTDGTAALRDAVSRAAAAGGALLLRGDWLLGDTIDLPNGLHMLYLDTGCSVIQSKTSAPAFSRTGTFEPGLALTGLMLAGERVATVSDTSTVEVGDIVIAYSSSTVPGSPDKIGYIRQITALTATSITFDIAVPRDLRPTAQAKVRKLRLAPPISVAGQGTVRHQNPGIASTEAAIRMTLCDRPVLSEFLITSWGGPGVEISHCWQGETSLRISGLPPGTGSTGFGYGVNVRGATRDHHIGGRITDCRHAVTTNAGPYISGLEYFGEPEQNVFRCATSGTSDKALDTHRVGWGNIMIPDVNGAPGGGIQIRADNTFVLGGRIVGASGIGIAVDAVVDHPPYISRTIIEDLRFGTGVLLMAPATLVGLILSRFGVGIEIRSEASSSRVESSTLSGNPGSTSSIGVLVRGNSNAIVGNTISQVGIGIQEDDSSRDNSWSLNSFSSVGRSIQEANYTHVGFRNDGVAVTGTVASGAGTFAEVTIGDTHGDGKAGLKLSTNGPRVWRQTSNTIRTSASIDAFMAGAADRCISASRNGDAVPRVALHANSSIRFGSGAQSADSSITRTSAGVLALGASGVLRLGSATSGARPSAVTAGIGGVIYDRTLKVPIFSDGTVWRDANGLQV